MQSFFILPTPQVPPAGIPVHDILTRQATCLSGLFSCLSRDIISPKPSVVSRLSPYLSPCMTASSPNMPAFLFRHYTPLHRPYFPSLHACLIFPSCHTRLTALSWNTRLTVLSPLLSCLQTLSTNMPTLFWPRIGLFLLSRNLSSRIGRRLPFLSGRDARLPVFPCYHALLSIFPCYHARLTIFRHYARLSTLLSHARPSRQGRRLSCRMPGIIPCPCQWQQKEEPEKPSTPPPIILPIHGW